MIIVIYLNRVLQENVDIVKNTGCKSEKITFFGLSNLGGEGQRVTFDPLERKLHA